MRITIPRYTVGADIETKDTEASAYLLSVGAVMFDNYTLKPVSVLNVTFDPEDPEQASRTSSPQTLDWWAGRGEGHPTQLAHDMTWHGRTTFNEGMKQVDSYFRSLPYGKFAMPMKGPDFDYVILRHALRQLGMYRTPLHARPLDSSRTVERVNHGLEIPPISDIEIQRFWNYPERIPHVAVYDAGYEGYETARMYHCLHLIKTIGYDGMLKEVEKWTSVSDSIIPIVEPEHDNPTS
jgi:hypothetical protein